METTDQNQSFQLKWRNYDSNLRNVFDEFLTAQVFLDVTVVCNDLKMKVHKAVLSAASPYLRDILLNNPCPHPIIILQDLDEDGLENLIHFIYKGEIHLTPGRLTALLKCAEALRITGVIDTCSRILNVKEEEPDDVCITANDVRLHVTSTDGTTIATHQHHLDSSQSEINELLTQEVALPVHVGQNYNVQETTEKINKKRKRRKSAESPPEILSADAPVPSSLWTVDDSEVIGSYRSEFFVEPQSETSLECIIEVAPALPVNRERLSKTSGGQQSNIGMITGADVAPRTSIPVSTTSAASAKDLGDDAVNPVPVKPRAKAKIAQYVCQLCGKGLCSKFKLKEHEQIHNPFRQTYSCTYCCRVYQHRTDLYRHHRHAHPDKPPPLHRR